jgi:hypothetical protein
VGSQIIGTLSLEQSQLRIHIFNQQNASEKTQQIQLMGRIFNQAEEVLVWLGPDSGVEDGRQVFQLLERLKLWSRGKSIDQHPLPRKFVSSLPGVFQSEDPLLAVTDIVTESINTDVLDAFLTRPYFRRRWVIQEITQARRIRVFCGDSDINGDAFLDGLQKLRRYSEGLHWRRILCYVNCIE